MSSTADDTATDSTWEMVKHVVDIEVLQDLNPSVMSIIYKVPSNLRKMDEEAFTPQLISIGPIHFPKQHLKEMFYHHAILQVSASKLYEAGVSFECVSDRTLIDITFETKKPFNVPSSCCRNYFKALLVFPW
ncbi:hypothetical protein PIB30_038600 [Stylosanthes scabra]|uniref:Uncharacterized protein n=1 Tax=Stylosanthes scabra TaxID=79078 RepID=A0ABU6RE53_9FABA|nr:hypothetical protein [Stylosanthes scabra]